MADGSTKSPELAEVTHLAESAYERFWSANALAVAAHDAGNWLEARRLNAVAGVWLARHNHYAISGAA